MILHLSHSTGSIDGGIAIAVAGLVQAQRNASCAACWLPGAEHPAWRRDAQLRSRVVRERPDLVHIHGLWRSSTRIAAGLNRAGVPLLIAPHGMLDPWAMAHSRRRKAVIWRLWERRALEAASCLQALCPAEMRAIRSLGLSAPVALIPNGVALPDQDAPLPPAPWVDRVPSGDRVLLFLGRFHAKKGLDPLLEAWRQLSREAVSGGWWLALVGYGDRGRLERRLELDPIPRCLLLDPCFGERKLAALATASAFVLPSFSEGLPVAALEAMSWGLPSLLSAACNLPEAFTAGAALQAEPEPRALEEALRRLFQLGDADLAVMGGAGRRLVADQFTWPRIAAQCAELYRWILGGGSPPSCVNGGT